jgi:hypothetical protein
VKDAAQDISFRLDMKLLGISELRRCHAIEK